MQKLNFPYSSFRTQVIDDRIQVFDLVRKRWVVLTPEEWVRQHLILYLNQDLGCPLPLMAVEKALKYNGMNRRSDLVIYGRTGKALLLAECKAPEITISKDTFDQAARYNMSLQVPYLLVTNGLQHFCCLIDFENETYTYIKDIPTFIQMTEVD